MLWLQHPWSVRISACRAVPEMRSIATSQGGVYSGTYVTSLSHVHSAPRPEMSTKGEERLPSLQGSITFEATHYRTLSAKEALPKSQGSKAKEKLCQNQQVVLQSQHSLGGRGDWVAGNCKVAGGKDV